MTNKVNIVTGDNLNVQSVSQAVASKLKEHRKLKKISLDLLSKRSGVSKGMLVEIEKGSANPSIAILCKLSTALGISVADIVNITDNPVANIIESQDIPILWKGELGGTAKLLAGTTGPDMIELWRWKMFPGEKFSSQGDFTGAFELFHVEEGELTLSIEETILIISEGASAIAKTDIPHSYSNGSDAVLIFTMTLAELHR